MTGVLVLLGTLAIAGAIGFALRAREGRIRTRPAADLPQEVRRVLDPDAAITLVQLSTTFCAPCRQARAVLADLADRTEGLHHVELDLTSRPELARALSVRRTPTTLALDARGAEVLRVGGVPRRDTLLEALRPHLSERRLT